MFLKVSCTITGMDEQDWERLGRHVIDRRVNIGLRTREALAAKSGLSTRLLGDIEKGRRTSYSPGTLAVIEQALHWVSGSAKAILEGGEPGYVDAFAGVDESGEELFFVGSGDPEQVVPGRPSNPPKFDPLSGDGASMNQFLAQLLRDAGNNRSRLTAAQLQELADEEWVRERMETFTAEERQMVKDYITELGNSRYCNWEDQFQPPTEDEELRHEENVTQPRTRSRSPEHDSASSGPEGRTPPMNASDKDSELTEPNQGSQADHELAARKGETEDEIRERLGIPYE